MNINRREFVKVAAAFSGGAALGSLTACSSSSSQASSSTSSSTKASTTERLASFMILSDSHINVDDELPSERFVEALKQISAFDIKPDTIFIVGDITNNGLQEQYDLLMKHIADSAFSKNDFTFVCGNHDHMVTDGFDEAAYAVFHKRFVDNTGVPSLYYETYIAGQHVIALGPDYCLGEDWSRFMVTQTQLEWLNELMEQDDELGAISYVFCHEPIDSTVTGTLEGEWGLGNSFADGGEALLSVLKKHPRSVFITGHTHIFPGVEASNPELPIFVNDGSSSRSYYSLQKVSAEELISDGIQMNIYTDHLEFNIRNFTNATWEESGIIVRFQR